tara:strand:+ start:814 stop:1101 length:288 start_codon:yes stop_codon:yes gene_type:complete
MILVDLLSEKRSLKEEFEAEVAAALMIKCNALIPISMAVRLCGISKKEILRRMEMGLFPKPAPLPKFREKSEKYAFYVKDIHEWIKSPRTYSTKN